MKSFEQKYGYLLRLYPASYREQRGAEMLAVLAEHGRPSMRERGALVLGGLRARLEADDDRTVVGDTAPAPVDRPDARDDAALAGGAAPTVGSRCSTATVRCWPHLGAGGPGPPARAFDRTVGVGRTPLAVWGITTVDPR